MTTDLDNAGATVQNKPRRRWRRWLIVLLIAALPLGWFGRFAYLRITLRPTPRSEYWEAKLAALDPPPPGAISPQKAFQLVTNRPWESDPALTSITDFDVSNLLDGPWDASREDIQAVTIVFEGDAFRTARQIMREAVEAGWRDTVSLDPASPMFAMADYRMWARWLTVHSRWSREHRGDMQTAVDDWLMTLKLSRQLRRQRTLIAHLVDIAIGGLVASEMSLTSQESPSPIDTLELARAVDEILGPALMPREFLAGEYLWACNYLDCIYVREGGDWVDVTQLAPWYGNRPFWGGPPPSPSRWWNLTSPLFHDYATTKAHLDAHLVVAEQFTDMRACNRYQQAENMGRNESVLGILDGFPLNMVRLVSLARTLEMYYAECTSIEAGLTMLALESYREERGGYPQTLSELVPGYLPRLPVDYADRQTLRYRLTDDGYALYSIGSNGIDEGGVFLWGQWATRIDNPDLVYSSLRRREVDQ